MYICTYLKYETRANVRFSFSRKIFIQYLRVYILTVTYLNMIKRFVRETDPG